MGKTQQSVMEITIQYDDRGDEESAIIENGKL